MDEASPPPPSDITDVKDDKPFLRYGHLAAGLNQLH